MVEGWHSSSTFASTIACYIILLELDKILLDHHISNQTCGTGHSISCILCTLSTFDGNKLTRMFMGVSVIENVLSPEWQKSLLLFVQNFAGKLKMFKSVKSTISTEPPVESADRDCHRVLSRCVIIEAFSSAASASRSRYWDPGHTSLPPVWLLFKSQLFICKIFLSSMLVQCCRQQGSVFASNIFTYKAMPCAPYVIFNNEDCTTSNVWKVCHN